MGFAFQPVRGNWETKLYDVLSTATFGKGCPVTLSGARLVQEATVGSPSILGIALHRSLDSLPAGKVLVQVPQDNTAVFTAPIETDVAASALSLGECYTFEKSGNTLRIDVDSQASAFVQLVGPMLNGSLDVTQISATSRVEAVWLRTVGVQVPSAASTLPFAP